MKAFKKFQSVTGGAQRGPSGGANSSGNQYANPNSRGGGNNRNRNKPKNRNRGGGGAAPENPMAAPVTPTPQTSTTPVQDANKGGLIGTIATDKPLDFFSGQLANLGQITGAGPSVYENWLQNQAFNDIYSKFMDAKVESPYDTSFDTYLTETYGAGNAGLTPELQRAFNLATPSQRGDFNNPYSNATGRTQFWG